MFQTLSFFQIKALITKTRKAESTKKIFVDVVSQTNLRYCIAAGSRSHRIKDLWEWLPATTKTGIHYTLMVSNALTFNYLLITNNQ